METPLETLKLKFISWHDSNSDIHIRTDGPFLFISKENEKMKVIAKNIYRNQTIKIEGKMIFSKTLSTHVIELSDLEIIH